jgi:hypothetical protein
MYSVFAPRLKIFDDSKISTSAGAYVSYNKFSVPSERCFFIYDYQSLIILTVRSLGGFSSDVSGSYFSRSNMLSLKYYTVYQNQETV